MAAADAPDASTTVAAATTAGSAEPHLFSYIRTHEIGADLALQTPFGARRVTYADYTASGRALSFIEDYVRDELLPTYGNTHTTTTKTGRQSSEYLAEARTMVRNFLRCGKHDSLIYLGSGATSGANRLVGMLGLAAPAAVVAAAVLRPRSHRPVVFVGPYEHHSNLLPWRESLAEVITIDESADGGIDLMSLESALLAAIDRPLKVGAFSAASNVTGVLTDVDAVTALLHTHGALACWDYATAAPHVCVEMNPAGEGGSDPARAALIAKDALYFSPHKFVGGPQTAGVSSWGGRARGGKCSLPRSDFAPDLSLQMSHDLSPQISQISLAPLFPRSLSPQIPPPPPPPPPQQVLAFKSKLLAKGESTSPGGGTVFWVGDAGHTYAEGEVEREEGGTPPILGAIRVALTMQLHHAVGLESIHAAETRTVGAAVAAWGAEPNLVVLGKRLTTGRLPIFSLAVRKGGLLLHHAFVVKLLNDLFGIQVCTS